ncbi:hypothetical protein [Dongia rigui]|uniref:Uncharacterized protein n=1 Tax=Dongia rigui TaxID=940149 RepID=A0ABU5DTT4_9PROT|nr:hypothetical protein [Dongia rigui]MDY0870734.1 hypothetical protein [Dongia rigui]
MKAELDHSVKADLERNGFMLLLGLFALAGLYVASRAGGGIPYLGGIGFSLICVAGLFYSIAKVKAFR